MTGDGDQADGRDPDRLRLRTPPLDRYNMLPDRIKDVISRLDDDDLSNFCLLSKILEAITDLKREFQTMSMTVSQQINAAIADLKGDITTLTTGVTNLEAELATALAGVTPGSTVTQEQVDALTSIHTSLASLSTSIPLPPVATTTTATAGDTTAPTTGTETP